MRDLCAPVELSFLAKSLSPKFNQSKVMDGVLSHGSYSTTDFSPTSGLSDSSTDPQRFRHVLPMD